MKKSAAITAAPATIMGLHFDSSTIIIITIWWNGMGLLCACLLEKFKAPILNWKCSNNLKTFKPMCFNSSLHIHIKICTRARVPSDLLCYICCLSAHICRDKLCLRFNRFYGTFLHILFLSAAAAISTIHYLCALVRHWTRHRRKTCKLYINIALKCDYHNKITLPLFAHSSVSLSALHHLPNALRLMLLHIPSK